MLDRLRERSLQEPETDVVEEEQESPLVRVKAMISSLGWTPQQRLILAAFLAFDVFLCVCLVLLATSKICLPGLPSC